MSPDQIESLERLKRAFDVGLITEREFEAAKRALLQEIGVFDAPRSPHSPGGLPKGAPDGVERQTTPPAEQVQVSSVTETRRLRSRSKRLVLLVAVGVTFLSLLFLFTLRGGGSFNKSAVQAEIEFLFSDLSPNESEIYLRFVGRACEWNQKKQLDFAEGRSALLDAADVPAFDHFRNGGIEDFLTLVGIGCGSTAQTKLTEVLTAYNGFFVPEDFLSPDSLEFFRKLQEDPSTNPTEWEFMTAVRPANEVNLGYGDVGDFSIPDIAFATWWRTVYTPTSASGLEGSTLDQTGNGFWKFWKRSDSGVIGSTPGEMDYFFCKHQGDGVCLIDTFLKVTPRSWNVYEFVGLGTIEEVERGEGSPGPIVVVVPPGNNESRLTDSGLNCPSVDGKSICFTITVMGFVFSGAEKAVLVNIKNHIPDSAGGAAFISDLRFYSPDSASQMTPCRLSSFGGEFFRDSAMKFDYLAARNLWFPEVHNRDPHYFTGGATFILCLPRQSKLDSNWSLEIPGVATYIPGDPYGLSEWERQSYEWSGEPLEP